MTSYTLTQIAKKIVVTLGTAIMAAGGHSADAARQKLDNIWEETK